MLPPALAPLAAWPQFVVWRIEYRLDSNGVQVPTKVPYSPIHGGGASSTNPSDWGTYEQALAYVTHVDASMNGVGFVFTAADPFFFHDIDKCLQADGSWSLVAQELCARFAGAAVEVSWSGTGLHIIGSCTKGFEHKSKNVPLHLELYTKERFVALSMTHAQGSVLANMDAVLPGVVTQFFTREVGETSAEWTTGPDAEWRGPTDDMELVQHILNSVSRSAAAAFGGKNDPTFSDLWLGDSDVLSRKWPGNGGGYDHSSADQSMANLLAFWTGRDCERTERIMRMSALCRTKWDQHQTYLQGTILKARALVTKVFQQAGKNTPGTPPAAPLGKAQVEEAGFNPREHAHPVMLSGSQLEHFGGCIYVTSLNKVLTPRGERLDQARFDVVYGGYDFVLSTDGQKMTASAWDAFTHNKNFQPPIADKLCFRPECGTGGIIKDAGKTLANLYVPAEVETTPGDPAKFLELLAKQLPVARDRDILLHWMASVVRNPGLKAQWWPILQATQGNGKTFILLIMSYAVGTHYSHSPNTEKMVKNGMNFNGWIEGKLFLGLEEVYASNRREFFEGFKTTVTNPRLPIEGKGIEEVTGDNRANGIITTQHKDGVPVTSRERRYAPFFMAQQDVPDLTRDGLTEAWFLDFRNWMDGAGAYADLGPQHGYRVITHHLRTMPLTAELDPAQLAIRAPVTSSTAEALLTSRGKAEQEVQEAVEEERPGFAGGWVSSIKLASLLDAIRVPIPHSKRRELMQTLGYDYHPTLLEGRVNNVVAPDNGKPRLFVKLGTIQAHADNYRTAADVAKAYSEAQLRASGALTAAGVAFNK